MLGMIFAECKLLLLTFILRDTYHAVYKRHTFSQNMGDLAQKSECRNWTFAFDVEQSDRSVNFDKSGFAIGSAYVFICLFFKIHFLVRGSTVSPQPYPGFRGCSITSFSRLLWVNYAALAVVQSGTCSFFSRYGSGFGASPRTVVLALMVISGIRACLLPSDMINVFSSH